MQTSRTEKHFKLKMWLLGSPVCFFFISVLSAAGTAGGDGQKQVATDDLPRSGGATRGGDPGRADRRFA